MSNLWPHVHDKVHLNFSSHGIICWSQKLRGILLKVLHPFSPKRQVLTGMWTALKAQKKNDIRIVAQKCVCLQSYVENLL